MGLMKRLRTAETNGHPIPEGGKAIIKACRAEEALRAWQAHSGPPEPPQANTGFYLCDGAYHWVGTGPWPEYRPPGLAWDRGWKQPKPADVPWRDEARREAGVQAAWNALEAAVASRVESGKPYTVDDAWNEVRLAEKALAKEAVASFFNGSPPPPKPKRSKKRTDGLTQGSLF